MHAMKKLMPLLAVFALALASCSGPSPDDLRRSDPDGHAACVHFAGSLAAPEGLDETNRKKAAEHGSAALTAAIRDAVSTGADGQPEIRDGQAFAKACKAQGFDLDN